MKIRHILIFTKRKICKLVGRASQRERVPSMNRNHGLSSRSPSYEQNHPTNPKGIVIRHIVIFILSTAALAGDSFEQGIEAYHEGDYAAASESFEAAIAADETAAGHHNLALALYQQGKPSQAVWHLERATLLQPTNEQYLYKLGALRQQLGLMTKTPKWYEIAAKLLSLQSWVLLLSVSFWACLAAWILPKLNGSTPNLQIKAVRAAGILCCIVAASALYLSRGITDRGIVLSSTPTTLHAAPASAAPQSGLARPGERGQKVDQYGKYLKIQTEGGATGWISQEKYRLLHEAG